MDFSISDLLSSSSRQNHTVQDRVVLSSTGDGHSSHVAPQSTESLPTSPFTCWILQGMNIFSVSATSDLNGKPHKVNAGTHCPTIILCIMSAILDGYWVHVAQRSFFPAPKSAQWPPYISYQSLYTLETWPQWPLLIMCLWRCYTYDELGNIWWHLPPGYINLEGNNGDGPPPAKRPRYFDTRDEPST